jgi:uncharacterized membrane protein
MVTSNKDLMKQARESLSGRWGLAVGTFFVYILIIGGISGVSGGFSHDVGLQFVFNIALLLVSGAFVLGVAIFSLAIARKEDAKFEMIFYGFKYYVKTLGLYLLMVLFILLWMLLLIVPGIIAAISYGLAFFLMADDPNIGIKEALDKSKKMMYGYKWKYFCLGLRFIGWILLCILTLGIGFFWLAPYIQVSYAKFYDDVKANYVEGQ